MNYPFWDVPLFGSGWVIGCIAIFHVMISAFRRGGWIVSAAGRAKGAEGGAR